ncbi:hypothetical protein G9272_16795 [Streptomyces asoensis]|uniref:Uncharacterized protein n=1 Tax=Streptomyces asoensis TaxID=249586 RepID=A0A6M4WN03_9ACTN|nr:hypothetical protein [Streptomyces asoensis]QJT01764.1 hypothetical protein G9272_16795 [Streptomyces asoensis]
MDQAKATTPTPTTMQADARASYDRATALAARLVDRSRVLPMSVDVATFGGPYIVRLHFGPGLEAGRAVLDIASTADGDAVRDEAASCTGDWIECRTVIDGVPVVARALLTKAHADELMQQTPPTPAAPAAQPVPLAASALARP